MSRKKKQSEGLPKLVKYILRLGMARNRGEPTDSIEEWIRYTCKNESELALAMHWFGSIDRVPYLVQAREQMERDLFRQGRRQDLTRREGLLLVKAFKEKEETMAAAARRQLETKRRK
jgi:hypothetical protein